MPIGSDHAMDASATVESATHDEGGEGDEVLIPWVHKRLPELESVASSEQQGHGQRTMCQQQTTSFFATIVASTRARAAVTSPA